MTNIAGVLAIIVAANELIRLGIIAIQEAEAAGRDVSAAELDTIEQKNNEAHAGFEAELARLRDAAQADG